AAVLGVMYSVVAAYLEKQCMKFKETILLALMISPVSTLACDVFSEIIVDNISEVEECIVDGADVNKKSIWGVSPLIIAVNHSDRISHKIVKLLIDAKADVNYSDEKGTIPIIYSSRKGYIDIVRWLLEANADVNAKDKDGKTPLIHASIENQLEVVKLLVSKGADVSIKDNTGQDAIARAKSWKRTEVVAYLETL